MDKIKKVLDEKITDKEAKILSEGEVKYKLDEKGDPVLDEKGDPIVVDEKKDEKDMKDKKDMKGDEDDDDDEDDDKMDVKESLSKIFAKAEISEEIVSDLETLFNAAVDEKFNSKVKELEVSQQNDFRTVVEELESKVDKYISYVAEEWLKENEIEIETGIKVEISENLVQGLKTIFEDSYVEVPESKIDLIKEAEETIDNLLTAVDEEKARTATLQAEVNDIKSKKIVDEMSSDMTDIQKEKLGTLTDSIEYKDDSDYRDKIGVVIESYFNKKDDIKKENLHENDGAPNDRMSMYVNHLRKKD